jgi:hypothetical protein
MRRSSITALVLCAPMVLVSPIARADGLDVIFDPIINSIDHALTGVDALSGLDLAGGLDPSSAGLDQWLSLPADSVAGVGSAEAAAT